MNFKIYYSLLPFSLLYGAGVKIRNKLFDRGILKETSFPVPLISVGNITVGGTGKTPHTEYLVNLLKDKYKVAVLSRGYKRKSKGFQICSEVCSADMLGDEPYQIASKFPEIIVAVDADRINGISRLMELDEAPDVIILDDAYQHRYVKPGLNILLTDYNRLLYKDFMLPAGRLRERSEERRVGKEC